MAFTVNQDVSGAAAAAGPVITQVPNPPSVSVLGGLLDVADSYARAQRGSSTVTQTDKDRAAKLVVLRDIQAELASGKSQAEVAQKYIDQIVTLGVNEEEKARFEQVLGADIFAKPKTPLKDANEEIFNALDPYSRAGRISAEMASAAEAGTPITEQEAGKRAVQTYAAFQISAQAGIIQGNLDWQAGYDQNIKTLDGFTDAVSKGLQTEVKGEDFSLDSLQRLRAAFLQLKSQPSFQKPTSKAAQDQWAVMEGKLKSIDAIFDALEDYDAKAATAEAKRLMATIALSGENPLSVLVVNTPEFMEKMAAKIAPDLTEKLSSTKGIPVVDHSTLDFDPVILELMGVAPSGNQTGVTPEGGFPVPPNPFPDTLSEDYNKMNVVTKSKSRAYHTSVITALEAGELTTPEAVNAYASSVTALSFDLTQNDRPSSKTFDALFSNSNIARLDKLQAAGGESGRVAAQLRAQMGAALAHNQAQYGILAAGKVDSIPNVGIDPETGKFILSDTSNPVMQEIAAVADVYYGGDFEALWKDGSSARIILRDRLAREGRIEFDSPEYKRFLAATNVLDSSLWRGMSSQYSKVKGIPQRLQKFKDVGKRLKIALPEEEVAADSVETLNNTITQTTLPPAPLSPVWSEEGVDINEIYNNIPNGVEYFDPDGNIRTKGGE